jgi:hypothetical protein
MKMRKTIIAAAALFIGGAGVMTFAVPAFAASGPTTATVLISGGALSISVPTSANLGTTAVSTTTQTVTGLLGNVVVSDLRGGTLGWVATAISTNFTGSNGGTISVGAMTYTPGTAVVVGVATPSSLTGMGATSAVQTATAASGPNTATWDPSIGVPIPAGALAGTYTATITHSVS